MKSEAITILDDNDKLANKIREFELPENVIYLNGNSLGPLSKRAKSRVQQIIDQEWGADLIASWNKYGWIDLPVQVGEKIAPLIGAAPGQVICCDSISVNLFKLLSLCLSLQADRFVVLSQTDNFPTDLYVAQGLEQLVGSQKCSLELVDEENIEAALDEHVAVLMLTHVNFRNGSVRDMQALSRKAHDKGILVIWDLAHSAGVLPLELDAWGVDFAVGCGYKYLNGGPGAPAFVYSNRIHHGKATQSLQGWMGHVAPFEFNSVFAPAPGMVRFLTGTPPILSMGALDAALDVFEGVDVVDLHGKSSALSSLFLELVQASEDLVELRLESPAEAGRRGGQIAFSHANAYGICRALGAQGVVVDFRSPDILRFGFSPLFLAYSQIEQAVSRLVKIMQQKSYLKPEFNVRNKVT